MPNTFVLIHGAWHGGWAWRPVAEQLRAAGHRVVTPTLPGMHDGDDPTSVTLADAIDFVVDVVNKEESNDITLVAHSWGGYVLTGAAPRVASKLRKLVYWSAFVPAAGRTPLDEMPGEIQELFTALAKSSGNNTVPMPLEVWQQVFVQDGSEDIQRLTHALMVPHPFQFFTTKVDPIDRNSFHVPISYVLSVDDIAMPPGGDHSWTRFADRLGVQVLPAPGSHEACFTCPAELAEAIMKA